MGPLKHLAILAILATTLVFAIPEEEERRKKAIGIFNIVKFDNDVCQSDNMNMNGTCYTAEECTDRNGVASGTCAEGYGVCCIITLTCGSTTSENCTYLEQAASANPATDPSPAGATSCTYTICPRDSTINRIRFNMQMFQIDGPVGIPTTEQSGTPTADAATSVNSVGSCNSDVFVVTGTQGPYPVICGMNNGQHVIVDTDGTECVNAVFGFGGNGNTRRYTIHVLQFAQSNDMGGPPGCLQFFTGETGIVRSFNWQGQADRTTSVHLANQFYDICVRPLEPACAICWFQEASGSASGGIGSFGISESAAGTNLDTSSATGAGCDGTDRLRIPFGFDGADVFNIFNAIVNLGENTFCGRYLNANNGAPTDGTVCSPQFHLTVEFNGAENGAGDNIQTANTNEVAVGDTDETTGPFGTMGFSLEFEQQIQTCP